MQAVILAAGKSTRVYPLTLTRPKPLLKAANRTLLEHNLDSLSGIVDEVIIIVGYKKNMIMEHIGNRYNHTKVKYVEQKQQLGTAHAASLAWHYIKGRFVLLMGDDIYPKADIKRCINYHYSILAAKAKNPQNFGVITEKNGVLTGFTEKPKKFISSLVSTALYSLDKQIFRYTKKIKKSGRKEFELPDAIKLLAKEEKVNIVKTSKWLPIGNAFDLLKADMTLRKNENIIGKNSKISGNISDSSIGNGCIVMGRVKNSIVMDGAIINKHSIVENSVIGENSYIDGRALGCIIADNTKVSNSTVKNCRIWPNKSISNKTVQDDVK